MPSIKLIINDVTVEVEEGRTILDAARAAEIYIPSLCAHPDLPPLKEYPAVDAVYHGSTIYEPDGSEHEEGCRLCMVDVGGKIVRSCITEVADGMVVKTDTDEVIGLRKTNISKILENHPHACLTCAQQEGCTREPCSTNVPVEERCCSKFGNCELQKVAQCIGIPETTPKWVPTSLPKVEDEPIFIRDYNLCIGCSRCVRACNDVRGVKALGMLYMGGDTIAGTIEPTLKASECKFCGACVEVCPTGALVEKHGVPAYDKANKFAPCTAACPAHIDIPRYVRLIAEGKPDEAMAVIYEKVPFPRVLGRICMHPCESSCRRTELNDPVAICALKRYASENDEAEWRTAIKENRRESTGKKVAIIGSGPAGMTAAFYTARAGHSVTVFESSSTPGGMLTHTIPLYRLPKEVFDADLQDIMESGDIELRIKQTLGKNFSIPELQSGGYDAIYIAIGLQASRKIEVEGIDSGTIIWGIDFLKKVRAGEPIVTGKNVVVVGGGNVAVDVARTVRRLGADRVAMVCLETREEMPAHDWEIAAAEQEGVEVHCSWGPLKIKCSDGVIESIIFKHCTCVFDSAGRFCPEYDEADTTEMLADTVILAIGQTIDQSAIDDNTMELLGDNNLIKVDLTNCRTDIDGIWSGGDVIKVPGSVIDAIAQGRTAAGQINRYLGGSDDISEVLIPYAEPSHHLGRHEGFNDRVRRTPKCISDENRTNSFDEVELTYSEEAAEAEAARCLQCDLRLLFSSNPMPPELYLPFTDEHVQAVCDKEGVFQLLDENKEVLMIKGTMNLRKELLDQLGSNEKAKYFIYEEDPMYTQRESELLQQYMQKHGRMPGGADEDDDLF